MVWVLIYHSVSYDCWTHRTIPTSVLKPKSNSVKNFPFLTSSMVPFLNKIVNSHGVIDFAFFRFSKIALKLSTKLGVLNRQWILHKCQWETHLFQELSFISIAFMKLLSPPALIFAPYNLNFLFCSSILGRTLMCCFVSSFSLFLFPLGASILITHTDPWLFTQLHTLS